MERILWKGCLSEGKEELYEKMHREIWPEMVANLKEQGISNYSIFRCGSTIIGYYECEDVAHMREVKARNPVAARWAEAMKDIATFEVAGDGAADGLFRQVFYLE